VLAERAASDGAVRRALRSGARVGADESQTDLVRMKAAARVIGDEPHRDPDDWRASERGVDANEEQDVQEHGRLERRRQDERLYQGSKTELQGLAGAHRETRFHRPAAHREARERCGEVGVQRTGPQACVHVRLVNDLQSFRSGNDDAAGSGRGGVLDVVYGCACKHTAYRSERSQFRK